MPEPERLPPTAESGRHYLLIGAAMVAVLVGAYVLMGTPGLYQQVAGGPDVAQQPAPTPN